MAENKQRLNIRLDKRLLANIDLVASATNMDRTKLIEKFCYAGLVGLKKLIDERKYSNPKNDHIELAEIVPED